MTDSIFSTDIFSKGFSHSARNVCETGCILDGFSVIKENGMVVNSMSLYTLTFCFIVSHCVRRNSKYINYKARIRPGYWLKYKLFWKSGVHFDLSVKSKQVNKSSIRWTHCESLYIYVKRNQQVSSKQQFPFPLLKLYTIVSYGAPTLMCPLYVCITVKVCWVLCHHQTHVVSLTILFRENNFRNMQRANYWIKHRLMNTFVVQ